MFRKYKMQIDLFNQELVQEKNGELLVSSITIAENIDLLHDSIVSNILNFEKEFGENLIIVGHNQKQAISIFFCKVMSKNK